MKTPVKTLRALCLSALLALPFTTGCLTTPAGDEDGVGVASEAISGIIVMVEGTWYDPAAGALVTTVSIDLDREGYDDLAERGYALELVLQHWHDGRRITSRKVVDLVSINPEPKHDGTMHVRISVRAPTPDEGSTIEGSVSLTPPSPFPIRPVDANPTPYPMPPPIGI